MNIGDNCNIATLGQTLLAAKLESPASNNHEYVSCLTGMAPDQVVFVPCGHPFCHECLVELFQRIVRDETLFPPKCCNQEIQVMSVSPILGSNLLATFQEKAVEFTTADRIYCHRPTCSTFIPPASVDGDRACCPVCNRRTCTICKGKAHREDCPEDPATKQILETAEQRGWKQCPNCTRLVEITTGCNHMTYEYSPLQSSRAS